jgi:hypothetical protein
MKQFSEVFDEIKASRRKHEKVAVMVKYGTTDYNFPSARTFQAMLLGNFHPGVKFDTPIPDYKPMAVPISFGYTSLYDAIQRIYIFQTNDSAIRDLWRPQNPRSSVLSVKRKTEILIQILEGLQQEDAVVLTNFLSKNFQKAYGITEAMVREAFPGLLGPVT